MQMSLKWRPNQNDDLSYHDCVTDQFGIFFFILSTFADVHKFTPPPTADLQSTSHNRTL